MDDGTPPPQLNPDMARIIEDQLIDRVVLRLDQQRKSRRRFNFAPIQFAVARLSEASSYAGLSAIVAMLSFNITGERATQIAQGIAAIFGLMAVLMKGGEAKTSDEQK